MSDTAEFGASKPDYLHAEALEVALKSLPQIHLTPGEILVQQGEASDAAFFLKPGNRECLRRNALWLGAAGNDSCPATHR